MEKIYIEPKNSIDALKRLKNDAHQKSGLKKSNPFNKLAQLDHRKDESLVISGVKHQLNLGKKNCISKSKAPFRSKAQSKAFTNAYLPQLRALHSPLANGYDRTAMCTHTMTQRGSKVTSEYCKQRWCNVCSRIMTAHLIDGYGEELSNLKDSQFLTLTIPNVSGKRLRSSIENMVLSFIKIKRRIERRHGIKIKGIRKIECTFSEKRSDYHPHFHFIIEGKYNAEMLLKEWLIDNPTASRKGQDIRKASIGAEKELLKYFAKMVNGSTFYAKSMDTIFQAVRGKRVFQAFGMKKQINEEDIKIEAQNQIHLGIKDDKFEYIADYNDWVSESGEVAADYTETESIKRYNKEVSESSKRLDLGIKERVRLNWGQYPTIEPISNLIF
jgi:hypothetical protein